MRRILVVILLLLSPILFVTPVFAQQFEKNEVVTLPKGKIVNEDYFAFGEKVTISGTVNGDVYVAGGNVVVDGIINGDLLVAGGSVAVSGRVAQDVRAAGGNILISSPIGGNATILSGNTTVTNTASISGSLVTASGNVDVASKVQKGITAAVGSLTLSNAVGGNVLAGVDNLDLTQHATISGNLTYFSDEEARIAQGASVSGQIRRNNPHEGEPNRDTAQDVITDMITKTVSIVDLLTSLILGLLLVSLFPTYTTAISTYAIKNPMKSFLYGAVAMLSIPIIAGILAITLFGIPLSILLLIYFFVGLYCAKVLGAYALGQKILPYIRKGLNEKIVFVIGLLIFELIGFIPIVGSLFIFFVVVAVFGSVFVEKKKLYTALREKKFI